MIYVLYNPATQCYIGSKNPQLYETKEPISESFGSEQDVRAWLSEYAQDREIMVHKVYTKMGGRIKKPQLQYLFTHKKGS